MEALILIFGEMIFALLAPLVAVVVDIVAAILAAIFSFIPEQKTARRVSSGAARKVVVVLLAIAAVIFSALFIVNKFYFVESMRGVFGFLERRSGIEVECVGIGGNVFSGRIALDDCTIVRTGHPGSDFDLTLDHADLDLNIGTVFGTAEVQSANVAGLNGSVTRHAVAEESSDDNTVEKPRRSFVIQALAIEAVDLNLSGVNKDGGKFELPIKVDGASSAPLRSRLALFDILFRSNVTGEVAGSKFEIQTEGDSGTRETIWQASDVPVASFGAMAGGVLSWFHDGVVDLYVVDTWRGDGDLEIDMDWRLGFRSIEVRAPESAGVMTRLATGPIVDYVNSYGGDFPFEFQMVVNENQFEYKSSLAAAGLWTAVGESVNSILAEFGVDVGQSAAETGETLKEEAKSMLDRIRGPRDEN